MTYSCEIWRDHFQSIGVVILEMASSWKELTVIDFPKSKYQTQNWNVRLCMSSYSSPSFSPGCSSTSSSFSSSYWLSGDWFRKWVLWLDYKFCLMNKWWNWRFLKSKTCHISEKFMSWYSVSYWSMAIQFKWYLTPATATGPISVL